jgi:hypothetical protein
VLDHPGTITIPALQLSKLYKLAIAGLAGSVNATGYAASGKLTVKRQ